MQRKTDVNIWSSITVFGAAALPACSVCTVFFHLYLEPFAIIIRIIFTGRYCRKVDLVTRWHSTGSDFAIWIIDSEFARCMCSVETFLSISDRSKVIKEVLHLSLRARPRQTFKGYFAFFCECVFSHHTETLDRSIWQFAEYIVSMIWPNVPKMVEICL